MNERVKSPPVNCIGQSCSIGVDEPDNPQNYRSSELTEDGRMICTALYARCGSIVDQQNSWASFDTMAPSRQGPTSILAPSEHKMHTYILHTAKRIRLGDMFACGISSLRTVFVHFFLLSISVLLIGACVCVCLCVIRWRESTRTQNDPWNESMRIPCWIPNEKYLYSCPWHSVPQPRSSAVKSNSKNNAHVQCDIRFCNWICRAERKKGIREMIQPFAGAITHTHCVTVAPSCNSSHGANVSKQQWLWWWRCEEPHMCVFVCGVPAEPSKNNFVLWTYIFSWELLVNCAIFHLKRPNRNQTKTDGEGATEDTRKWKRIDAYEHTVLIYGRNRVALADVVSSGTAVFSIRIQCFFLLLSWRLPMHCVRFASERS